MATDLAYCIHCWAMIPVRAPVCPACGAPTADAGADIVDKYIAALHHPQAETRLRAAWMLGRMRARRAIPALQEIVRTRGQNDPYLLSAAAQSLSQIGDDQAVQILRDLLGDRNAAFMARVQAVNALSHIFSVLSQAALLEAASDPNERVREAAAAALQRGSERRD
jgi:HEAT repeat protein